MTRFIVCAGFVATVLSCLPAQSPSATYGEALRACDAKPSDDEWIDCCVKAARAYGRDPGFCFL